DSRRIGHRAHHRRRLPMGAPDGRGAAGLGPGSAHLFVLRGTLCRRPHRRPERVARVRPVMLLLRETDVRALLAMEALIALMEEALRAYSTGGAAQPVRLAMMWEPHAGCRARRLDHLRR